MKARSLVLMICALVSFATSLFAQTPVNNQPDRTLYFSFSAAGRSDFIDNRSLGCTTFHMSYNVTGFSADSIQLDAAPNSSGVPGSWAAWSVSLGSLPAGTALPLTNTTGGQATGFKYVPFISVNLNSVTGTGTITGRLDCWRPGGGQDSSSSGGEPVLVTNLPTTVDVNSGVKSNSTLRVVLVTDQPQLTNKLLVTPDSVALPANQSVNVAQMNGVTTSMNSGTPDTGTQRVVQAQTTPSDASSNTSVPGPQSFLMVWNGATWDRLKGITGQVGLLATGKVNSGTNPSDAYTQMFTELNNAGNQQLIETGMLFNNTNYDRPRSGNSANLPNLLGSTLVANVAIDPCASSAITKSHAFANISTATTTALVPVSGSTNILVCGIDFQSLSTVTTNTVIFESGTGSACAVVTGCISAGICTSTFRNGAVATYPPVHLGFGGHTLFATGASNGLCALTTVGTGPTISIDVTYVQQ